MLAIAGLLLLGYIAQQSLMNVYVIYADYRYHSTDRTVGFSLATVGIFTAIYGALLVKPVAKLGERGATTLGLIGGPSATPCSAFQRQESSSGWASPSST
jgi:DHA1 family tetracycline resistance protein-like MFS transporter